MTEEPDHPPHADEDWIVAHGPDLRRVSPPDTVGDLLGDVVQRRRWRDRLRGVEIHQRWADIVGEELVRRCEPVRLAGGTLLIRAVDQTWATQLRYMLPQLRQRAGEILGPDLVERIQVTVGALEGDQDGA